MIDNENDSQRLQLLESTVRMLDGRMAALEQQLNESTAAAASSDGAALPAVYGTHEDAGLQVYFDNIEEKWYLRYRYDYITYNEDPPDSVSPSPDKDDRIALNWLKDGSGDVEAELTLEVTTLGDIRFRRLRIYGDAESSSSSSSSGQEESSSSSSSSGESRIIRLYYHIASVGDWHVTQHVLGGIHFVSYPVYEKGVDTEMSFSPGSSEGHIKVDVYYK